jgi:hypothetical protein
VVEVSPPVLQGPPVPPPYSLHAFFSSTASISPRHYGVLLSVLRMVNLASGSGGIHNNRREIHTSSSKYIAIAFPAWKMATAIYSPTALYPLMKTYVDGFTIIESAFLARQTGFALFALFLSNARRFW